MDKNRVSVAMATFNGARFLTQQLTSLAKQELAPAELVIADDCSSDPTVEILRDFAKHAPFPVHIHVNHANKGWRANFMQAASLCKEPLIAFCDQDDIWYPSKLETMVSVMDDPSTLLSYHDGDLIDENGAVYGRMREGKNDPPLQPALTRPVHWESPYGLTVMFRRSLLALTDLWPMTIDPSDNSKPMAHDQWFVFLASCFGNIRFEPEQLLGYRQHGKNAVGFSGPDPSLSSKINGQTEMIGSCCRALEIAQDIKSFEFHSKVSGALKASRKLHSHLDLRRQLRSQRLLPMRLLAFVQLLTRGAYLHTQPLNFGYRNLLGDARAVLHAQ